MQDSGEAGEIRLWSAGFRAEAAMRSAKTARVESLQAGRAERAVNGGQTSPISIRLREAAGAERRMPVRLPVRCVRWWFPLRPDPFAQG